MSRFTASLPGYKARSWRTLLQASGECTAAECNTALTAFGTHFPTSRNSACVLTLALLAVICLYDKMLIQIFEESENKILPNDFLINESYIIH